MLGFTSETAHPLSFVKISADGQKNFWAPECTGDYSKDCQIGRLAATELVDYLRENPHASTIFGSIVRAMTEAGRFDAVEVGFCSVIGIYVAVNT